jgi:gliding motility-associated-like protein
LWNIGSDTSTVTSPVYSFSDTGNYVVTLIAWNNLPQCSDTISKAVYVKECPPDSFKMIAPNVFSPNGDGINETWQPLIYQSGFEVTSFAIEIYDRWGLKVFESDNVKQGWDGRTTSGMAYKEGTYYYVVNCEASALSGKKKQSLKGFIQLVR